MLLCFILPCFALLYRQKDRQADKTLGIIAMVPVKGRIDGNGILVGGIGCCA